MSVAVDCQPSPTHCRTKSCPKGLLHTTFSTTTHLSPSFLHDSTKLDQTLPRNLLSTLAVPVATQLRLAPLILSTVVPGCPLRLP